MKKSVIAFLVLIFVLVLVGCGNSIREYTWEKGKSPANQIIETSIGKQFSIALASNPTTGYMWELSFDEALLNLITNDFKVSKPGMIGSGGQEVFILQSLKSGETKITLVYKQPWEKQFAEAITFSVRIK